LRLVKVFWQKKKKEKKRKERNNNSGLAFALSELLEFSLVIFYCDNAGSMTLGTHQENLIRFNGQ
jgi:hypothetical protein